MPIKFCFIEELQKKDDEKEREILKGFISTTAKKNKSDRPKECTHYI